MFLNQIVFLVLMIFKRLITILTDIGKGANRSKSGEMPEELSDILYIIRHGEQKDKERNERFVTLGTYDYGTAMLKIATQKIEQKVDYHDLKGKNLSRDSMISLIDNLENSLTLSKSCNFVIEEYSNRGWELNNDVFNKYEQSVKVFFESYYELFTIMNLPITFKMISSDYDAPNPYSFYKHLEDRIDKRLEQIKENYKINIKFGAHSLILKYMGFERDWKGLTERSIDENLVQDLFDEKITVNDLIHPRYKQNVYDQEGLWLHPDMTTPETKDLH